MTEERDSIGQEHGALKKEPLKTQKYGGETWEKYRDIIHLEYPLKTQDKKKHPEMPMEERAKIFSPFSALKGYEEMIAERQKKMVESTDF